MPPEAKSSTALKNTGQVKKTKAGYVYQRVRARRWAFTVHGATDEQRRRLIKLFSESEDVELAVFSREMGEHSIHPHFQGYFECEKQCSMRERFGDALASKNFHLEPARASREHNLAYVYAVTKPYEIGWIQFTKGEFEIPDRYQGWMSRFMDTFKPKPFQDEIMKLVEGSPDNRTIHWFWEPTGNVGKTAVAKWLHVMYGALYVSGRGGDIKHALARMRELSESDPSILIVDLSRNARMTKGLLDCLESVKNGLLFSGKYDSRTLHMKSPPHVIVFANFPPSEMEQHSLSADRWKVRKIQSDGTAVIQSLEEISKETSESPIDE